MSAKNPMFSYLADALGELRHVTWPSRKEVIRHTGIIIISVAVAMLVIAILDHGLDFLVNRFIIK